MYYAAYHAIKFYAVALFVESSLFGRANPKVSFRFLRLVSCIVENT